MAIRNSAMSSDVGREVGAGVRASQHANQSTALSVSVACRGHQFTVVWVCSKSTLRLEQKYVFSSNFAMTWLLSRLRQPFF